MTDIKALVLSAAAECGDHDYLIDWYRCGAEVLSRLLWKVEFSNELDSYGMALLMSAQKYLADQVEAIHVRTGEFAD